MTSNAAGTQSSYLHNEEITSEGVAVDLPVASLIQRGTGRLVDFIVAIIGLIGVSMFTSYISYDWPTARIQAVLVTLMVLWLVVVPAAFEVLTNGKSVGKYTMGLRVVRDDGGPITVRQASLRALSGFLEFFPLLGSSALICGALNGRTKRLGDLAAGTYAITERIPLPPLYAPTCPPALAPWIQAADIAPLPNQLALAVRQYLFRLPTMAPAARESMGEALIAQIRPLVVPAPPAEAPTAYVLAAVLAERRVRDARRLAREAQLRNRLAERRQNASLGT